MKTVVFLNLIYEHVNLNLYIQSYFWNTKNIDKMSHICLRGLHIFKAKIVRMNNLIT